MGHVAPTQGFLWKKDFLIKNSPKADIVKPKHVLLNKNVGAIHFKDFQINPRIELKTVETCYDEHAKNDFNRYNEHTFWSSHVKIMLYEMRVTN